MKLSQLVQGLDFTLDAGSLDVEISALEYDSRKVVPGGLFVCLTGFQTDGHDYIPKALKAGAAALVVERETAVPSGITVLRVEDSRAGSATQRRRCLSSALPAPRAKPPPPTC